MTEMIKMSLLSKFFQIRIKWRLIILSILCAIAMFLGFMLPIDSDCSTCEKPDDILMCIE